MLYQALFTTPLLFLCCRGFEDALEGDLKDALGGGLSDGLNELMSSFGEAIDGLAGMAEGKAFECKYKCENGKDNVLCL